MGTWFAASTGRVPRGAGVGSGWCQQTPTAAAVTWAIIPWHLHSRVWSMAGQIGQIGLSFLKLPSRAGRRHRSNVCCEWWSSRRAPAARKCTVRALLAPSARATLLGRPFGRVEGAIRHRQDDLLGAERRWRGLGIPVNPLGRRCSREDSGRRTNQNDCGYLPSDLTGFQSSLRPHSRLKWLWIRRARPGSNSILPRRAPLEPFFIC